MRARNTIRLDTTKKILRHLYTYIQSTEKTKIKDTLLSAIHVASDLDALKNAVKNSHPALLKICELSQTQDTSFIGLQMQGPYYARNTSVLIIFLSLCEAIESDAVIQDSIITADLNYFRLCCELEAIKEKIITPEKNNTTITRTLTEVVRAIFSEIALAVKKTEVNAAVQPDDFYTVLKKSGIPIPDAFNDYQKEQPWDIFCSNRYPTAEEPLFVLISVMPDTGLQARYQSLLKLLDLRTRYNTRFSAPDTINQWLWTLHVLLATTTNRTSWEINFLKNLIDNIDAQFSDEKKINFIKENLHGFLKLYIQNSYSIDDSIYHNELSAEFCRFKYVAALIDYDYEKYFSDSIKECDIPFQNSEHLLGKLKHSLLLEYKRLIHFTNYYRTDFLSHKIAKAETIDALKEIIQSACCLSSMAAFKYLSMKSVLEITDYLKYEPEAHLRKVWFEHTQRTLAFLGSGRLRHTQAVQTFFQVSNSDDDKEYYRLAAFISIFRRFFHSAIENKSFRTKQDRDARSSFIYFQSASLEIACNVWVASVRVQNDPFVTHFSLEIEGQLIELLKQTFIAAKGGEKDKNAQGNLIGQKTIVEGIFGKSDHPDQLRDVIKNLQERSNKHTFIFASSAGTALNECCFLISKYDHCKKTLSDRWKEQASIAHKKEPEQAGFFKPETHTEVGNDAQSTELTVVAKTLKGA